VILRQCPDCQRDSIIGHGRRRKQAHDEDHDWILIRRGLCNLCGKTFTFLPPFSPPYTHYSLIARSQALRRYFVERCSWEAAAPETKDPRRVTDPSTLRRWFRSLDSSRPPFSFLRSTMYAVGQALDAGKLLHLGGSRARLLQFGSILRAWYHTRRSRPVNLNCVRPPRHGSRPCR
jgi:hypothetical protein